MLFLLFLVILLVPPTSAIDCFSGPESIFARLKILVFGEFLFQSHLSPSHYFDQPDLGMFLFDVGSDIYNDVTFIDEGIPMTVTYVWMAIEEYRSESLESFRHTGTWAGLNSNPVSKPCTC